MGEVGQYLWPLESYSSHAYESLDLRKEELSIHPTTASASNAFFFWMLNIIIPDLRGP